MSRINVFNHFKSSIAGLVIEYICDGNLNMDVPEFYREFIIRDGNPDLSLKVHYDVPPQLDLETRSTYEGVSYDFHRSDSKLVINVTSPNFGAIPYQRVVIDPDFRRGDLYVRPHIVPGNPTPTPIVEGKPRIRPTELFDKVLFVLLLNREHGVMMHGCGVVVNGEGVLFTGVAGSGKSTMANLWKKREDTTVIGDECIVIRRVNGQFWIYGTPWYSSAKIASSQGAPLKRVLSIKHSHDNYVTPLKGSEAVATLTAQSFSDYWENSSLINVLELLNNIVERVPCHELGFVPDESVMEYVDKM
ncbi:hypothetical protein ACFLXY_08830 [Chloroflexota bacterium]